MKIRRRRWTKKRPTPFEAGVYFTTPHHPEDILSTVCTVYGAAFDLDRMLQIQGNQLSFVRHYERKKLLSFGNVIVVFPCAQVSLVFTLDELQCNPHLRYFQTFIGEDGWHSERALQLQVLVTPTQCVPGAYLLVLYQTCLRSLPFEKMRTSTRHAASLRSLNLFDREEEA
jgi:hypothetical protein